MERVEVAALRIPTEETESDGTYRWDATVMVAVHLMSAGAAGFGYSYADGAAARLIEEKLAPLVIGRDPHDIGGCRLALVAALRNLGVAGIGMLAVSAVENALWDLKGKLLGLPVVKLLGGVRGKVPVYGSGGFTSYGIDRLQRQLAGWVEEGIPRVKMKIGSDPASDRERIRWGRQAIGGSAEFFIDANGAYGRKEALALAHDVVPYRVTWFEEPVVHTDREGLRQLRDRVPPGMEISVGEYGFTLEYFKDLVQAGAADVLQADATRCGVTGFMEAATLCRAYSLPLSSHCAPALHMHLCCAATAARHLEYFHDHVRIEKLLFEGFVEPVRGELAPDLSRPGFGLALRDEVARRYRL